MRAVEGKAVTVLDKRDFLRSLPSVDKVLHDPAVAGLTKVFARERLAEVVREIIAEYRCRWQEFSAPPDMQTITEQVIAAVEHVRQPSLRRVINATGIVLHTNLGRAVISQSAREAIREITDGYSNLEFNLEKGCRGSRYDHVRELLKQLTGAEDAVVVNNNAAAVLLVLSTLAAGRETIVSRGQLVEIGGSFRVPEVMLQSGTALVEVGTTNKTYIADYERAITTDTAVLLKVHTSNYRVIGFCHEAAREELVELAAVKGLYVVEDLGSGLLVDLLDFGLAQDEPTVKEAVTAGIDVVTFSGDKLLGGPQAGIIVGKADIIARVKRHPLARALRVDKMTAAGLEATLREYQNPAKVIETNPTLRMLTEPVHEVRRRADRLKELLEKETSGLVAFAVMEEKAQAGGGALPALEIPSYAVAVTTGRLSADQLAAKLRTAETAVVARIKNDRVIFDLRTVADEEIPVLARAVGSVLNEGLN